MTGAGVAGSRTVFGGNEGCWAGTVAEVGPADGGLGFSRGKWLRGGGADS